MRLGVSLNMHGPRAATARTFIDGMRNAEAVGFHGIWFFDTVGRGTFRVDPLSAMAAAAAVTERVELGTCILQVPLRRPVELAHRVLGVHYLSGGRVRLGVGAGSTEADFRATGNDYRTRFRALAQDLPIMRSLWRGETVGEANLTPLDSLKGGPPVLIGSWAGSRWIPIAAREYDGWIASAHFSDIATLREGFARFKGKGGGRAVATNIPVDFTAGGGPLSDRDHLDLRCGPAEAKERLSLLAGIGFDDAVVTVTDVSPAHMAAVRALLP